MLCPSCDIPTLILKGIDEAPAAKVCTNCNGQWISSKEYLMWLRQNVSRVSDNQYSDIYFDIDDSKEAKICPDCGRILIKFKVGHGLDFKLDHCNTCGGVWFDKYEWDVLKNRNLHNDIHSIFTTEWQALIRTNERERYLEEIYIKKFGDDYLRIKEFRKWLDQHDQKSSILAYLSDTISPFK